MNQRPLRVIICGAILVGAVQGYAAELIRNGSFEADGLAFSGPLANWDDGTDLGAATFLYQPPEERGNVPAGAGDFFSYAWGIADDEGFFHGAGAQYVDVSRHAGNPYDFSTWLASRSGDRDYAIITLEFFTLPDASGDSVGQVVFDGNDQQSSFIVGSANAEGLPDLSVPATQDNWTFYRATGAVPPEASSAAVFIAGKTEVPQGFINDAYVDLVSLQVVPEASSAVLTCLLAATGLVWSMRRRITSTSSATRTMAMGPRTCGSRMPIGPTPANKIRSPM